MTTERHQDDLDILKEIKSNMQEFRQQTQQQFREVFHLIEDLTIDVNSLKRHADLSTSPMRNLGENMEQGQIKTREVLHLIEGLTIELNSLKRHVNTLTSQIQNLGESMEQGCTERVETINDPQTAHVNEEFQMQEVLPNTEGIFSYCIVLVLYFSPRLYCSQG